MFATVLSEAYVNETLKNVAAIRTPGKEVIELVRRVEANCVRQNPSEFPNSWAQTADEGTIRRIRR